MKSWGILGVLALWVFACSATERDDSGVANAHGSGVVPPAPADWSRVLLVLDRQVSVRDFASDVLDLYADPTDVPFMTVTEVAEKYGASASVVDELKSYLAQQLYAHAPSGSAYSGYSASAWRTYMNADGGFEVDVTATFATLLIPKYLAEALFSEGLNPDSTTVPVPPGMPGVSDALTAFGKWTGANAGAPRRSPDVAAKVGKAESVGSGYYGSPKNWPDWTKTSGNHTGLECPAGASGCAGTWPYPHDEGARTFFPSQLRTAYQIPHHEIGSGRTAVVLEWGQVTEDALINAYVDAMNTNRPNGVPEYTFTASDSMSPSSSSDLIQHVFDGASTQVSVEATLDVESLLAIAPGLDRITLLNGPAGDAQMYFPFVISKSLDPHWTGGTTPDVVSMSYMVCEQEWQAGGGGFASAAVEPLFITAAAVGVTVSLAAGDQGSTGCVPIAPPYSDVSLLAVTYPGSSPWVTAVGGTNVMLGSEDQITYAGTWNDWYLQVERPLRRPGCSGDEPDCTYSCAVAPCRPAPVWAGSGGNSIIFEQPPWQQDAGVGGTKRAVPDVAFLAELYPGMLVALPGPEKGTVRWGSAGGTSQAAPLFAGMMALMNNHVQGRVGLSTPLLYEFGRNYPAAYWDVVENEQNLRVIDADGNAELVNVNVNNNIIGNTTGQFDASCCYAKAGYDRTTGWGSLLFDGATAAWDEMSVQRND